MEYQERISEWVQMYLKHVREVSVETHVRDEEGYKFKAVQHFQSNFNLEETDIAGNLQKSVLNNNLVVGAQYFPRKVMIDFAQKYPEEVRAILRSLFDESRDVEGRITEARAAFERLREVRNKEAEKPFSKTYIGLRVLSLLLSYRFPEKHNAIKPAEWKVFSCFIDPEFAIPNHTSPGEQYAMYLKFIEPLRAYLKQRPEIVEIKKKLVEGIEFRDSEFHWVTQDVIYVTARIYAGSRSEEAAAPAYRTSEVREEVVELEEQEPSANEDGTGFMPLEKHLEEYIVRNWKNIDFGENLELYHDEDGTPGQQYTTDVGIIDLLAKDDKGDFVVIELKRAESGHNVVGQILSYMGWVEEKLAQKNQKVRGLVIVGKSDNKLRAALRPVSDKIGIREYLMEMKLVRPN